MPFRAFEIARAGLLTAALVAAATAVHAEDVALDTAVPAQRQLQGVPPLPALAPASADRAEHPFFAATAGTVVATVAAVGDVLLHAQLLRQGATHADGYNVMTRDMAPWISQADVASFNMEGTLAEDVATNGRVYPGSALYPDDWIYSGYPLFNAPPAAGYALAATGFDVATTANNHALDRKAVGVTATIEALANAGIAASGTRTGGTDPMQWPVIRNVNGLNIAWLACAEHTNGLTDYEDQVLLCGDAAALDLIRTLRALDIADAVIVLPHWGIEFERSPTRAQRALARAFAEAGAAAVVGAHPHVLQEWERIDTADGREVLVAYSLGNFISNQQVWPRAMTMVLLLGLGFDADGGASVHAVRFLPAFVDHSQVWNSELAVRPATPDNPVARGRTAWCFGVKMFGLPWLHPTAAPVDLSSPPGAAFHAVAGHASGC